MSQLQTIIYNRVSMPVDLCNIIIEYASCIEQVCYNDQLYYMYHGSFIKYSEYNVLAKINNSIYILKTDMSHDIQIYKYNDDSYVSTITFDDNDVFCIKYSNKLICEHVGSIVIYDLQINDNIVTIRQLHQLSSYSKLMYVDYNYIITRTDNGCGKCRLFIRNDQLALIKYIDTVNTIDSVAMVHGMISYMCNHAYVEIIFFYQL